MVNDFHHPHVDHTVGTMFLGELGLSLTKQRIRTPSDHHTLERKPHEATLVNGGPHLIKYS